MRLESFEENPLDLLLNIGRGLGEHMVQVEASEVGVTVGVAQFVHNRVQESVSGLRV